MMHGQQNVKIIRQQWHIAVDSHCYRTYRKE